MWGLSSACAWRLKSSAAAHARRRYRDCAVGHGPQASRLKGCAGAALVVEEEGIAAQDAPVEVFDCFALCLRFRAGEGCEELGPFIRRWVAREGAEVGVLH